MAATAYASLVSLLNTMDQIQAHPRLSPNFYSCQLQSLGEIVDFLVDFVVNYSEKAEIAMGRIGDIAHEAEHMIEVAAADLIRDRSTLKSVEKMLEQMIQEMSSIKEEMIKFKEESVLPSSSSSDAPAITMPTPPLPRSSSSSSLRAAKNTMLGFNHHVDRLLEELIGHESRSRRIIPIVGMGGAGKTTLAKHVYGHPSVVELFDFRAWITVSQEHNAIHILSQALSCLGVAVSKDKADHELGHKLYQTLFRQKYLIVLDDLWSHVAWERVQHFFPNDDTGSRIVVTTRQQQVSKSLGKSLGFSSLDVGFLDFDISWDLFHEVTFAGQHCPPQLEGTAKKIVGKCRGLPLAICVIGGLLRKSTGTQEYWEEIAKDKSLVLEYSGDGNEPSNIFYMSYKHLPVWLRPCFLYLGLFPEDSKIDVASLIKLWVAEGFIKPTKSQSMEQVAESYIRDLVGRNLLLVESKREIVTIHDLVGELCGVFEYKTVTIHDIVRELCIKTAEKENFYCVQRDLNGGCEFIRDEKSAYFYPQESVSFSENPIVMRIGQRQASCECRLSRVLIDKDWLDTCEQVNLRYLYQDFGTSPIPSSIALCWSLQTLNTEVANTVVLPSEIWNMPQLRHIIGGCMRVSDPPPGDILVLHNLQTLVAVENLVMSEEVCSRIPNIRVLGVVYRSSGEQVEQSWSSHLHNLVWLSKLESLELSHFGEPYVGDPFEKLQLPNSLKELTLINCNIAWSGMGMIASLPHLEFLQLNGEAVVGPEWNFDEEIFHGLKRLIICHNHNLVNWTADCSNFPLLETLLLWNVPNLDEIPLEIGEIPTLENIIVVECSESVNKSARKIIEEQEDMGNLALRVVFSSGSDKLWWTHKSALERIEEEDHEEQIRTLTFTTGADCSAVKLTIKFKIPLLQEDMPTLSIAYSDENLLLCDRKRARGFKVHMEDNREAFRYEPSSPGGGSLFFPKNRSTLFGDG